MLAEVLGLVLSNEIVKGSDHVWQKSVVFASKGCGKDTVFMPEEVGVIDVEGGKPIEPHSPDLGNVVFVCSGHSARSW